MSKRLIHFARQLRKDQTEAETKLWKHLRARQFYDLKFRRQQPIGSYIVDFVCFEKRIIIELDGSQHLHNKDRDIIRDRWLTSQGFVVLRFWNNEIIKNTEGVLLTLQAALPGKNSSPLERDRKRTLTSSPWWGGLRRGVRNSSIHPPPAPPVKGGGNCALSSPQRERKN